MDIIILQLSVLILNVSAQLSHTSMNPKATNLCVESCLCFSSIILWSCLYDIATYQFPQLYLLFVERFSEYTLLTICLMIFRYKFTLFNELYFLVSGGTVWIGMNLIKISSYLTFRNCFLSASHGFSDILPSYIIACQHQLFLFQRGKHMVLIASIDSCF